MSSASVTGPGRAVQRGRPADPGPFERLAVAASPWGPVLAGSRPRAACRLAGSAPVGDTELVEGVIEQLELPDPEIGWPTCMDVTGRWMISPTTVEQMSLGREGWLGCRPRGAQ
jgi:hypothetical protein